MATLVLSTVGNVLGGPVGGAIGALIGQSIDQQIFGPGPRQGPRLNDLAVQTSSYGTAIPRIYGRMRVAGSVIWATDLMESATVQSGGKGQPDVETFSYTVSLAVALSSRSATSIGRIWADGKLLRGAAGDFKVRTGFRFYPGDEEQDPDPLIATIEGIGLTPAFRGLAVAVFEDLELSEFGNRIPFLTFEIVADEESPGIGAVMTDVSSGTIQSALPRAIHGFAAHGASRRAAIMPLADHFGIALRDSGTHLESSAPTLFAVDEQDLGCAPDGRAGSTKERAVIPQRSIPASLQIDYYDPARDYQTSRMHASAGSRSGPAESIDLPVVLGADNARSTVEDSIARRWAERDRLILRLPPYYAGMLPGDLVELSGGRRRWTVRRLELDAMIVVAELQPAWEVAPVVQADPGRPAPAPDTVAGPTRLALLDLPDVGTGPALHLQLAAASSTESWRQVPIQTDIGGTINGGTSAAAEALMGSAVTVLPANAAAGLDLVSAVDIELANGRLWLESRDDDALMAGANLAAIGREIIQFGSAVPIGAKRFRLTRLLRGRFGSEWATAGHAAGEPFVMLEGRSVQAIAVPDAMLGSTVGVTAYGIGDSTSGTRVSESATGEALRPPSPVHLRAMLAGGTLGVKWIRRSRSGFSWLDEVEAPLGESRELYRVRVQGSAGMVEADVSEPEASFAGAQLAAVGSGPAEVSVAQVGDRGLSRWTRIPITFP